MNTATITEPEATTTIFTCWDAESGAEADHDAIDAEAAAKAYVAEAGFGDESKTFWVEIYAVDASDLPKVECIDDRYDPDGGTYANVGEFLAMCRECFEDHAVPVLTETDGEWVDEDYETVLVSTGAREQAVSHTIAIEPTEPKCEDGHEHNWIGQDDLRCHGGGVKYSEKCEHCGAIKLTDTWAQNRVNGEQGLDSTEYKPAGWSIIDDY